MEFDTDVTDDGIVVIRSEGRLNMASAPQLRSAVSESRRRRAVPDRRRPVSDHVHGLVGTSGP